MCVFKCLFLAVLGLIAPGAVNRGYSLVVIHGLLIVVVTFVAEHGLLGLGASVGVAHGLGSCGA